MTRIAGTLYEDQYTFFTISCSFFLSMGIVWKKLYRKSKRTIMFNIFFFLNRVVYEITWKNIVQPDRPHMRI